MGHPPVSLASTQVQYPLPEHRRIDQGLAPERVANTRTAPDKIAKGLVRDEHHLAGGQRTEAVVHHVEVQALQVGNIARDVERKDLALAGFGQLVAISKAVEDQAALGRAVALAHEVLPGTDRLDGPAQLTERVPLVL